MGSFLPTCRYELWIYSDSFEFREDSDRMRALTFTCYLMLNYKAKASC